MTLGAEDGLFDAIFKGIIRGLDFRRKEYRQTVKATTPGALTQFSPIVP